MSKLAHMFYAYKHLIFAISEHQLIQMQIECKQFYYIIFAVFIGSLKLHTKFDCYRIIYDRDMKKAIFKMAVACHLEFVKIAILVMGPISACDSSSLVQIWH